MSTESSRILIAATRKIACSLLNVGARLGIACGLCRHHVLAVLTKLREGEVWRMWFVCSNCGEKHTVFKYVRIGERALRDFERGEHPRVHHHGGDALAKLGVIAKLPIDSLVRGQS